MEEMPPQIGSEEAVAIEALGVAVVVITATVFSIDLGLSIALGASLNQVWSMINSQQIIFHLPLYDKLKFPASAMIFAHALLRFTTLSMINTAEWIDPLLFYLPEEDAFNISFAQCGYESLLLIVNISVVIWMYIINLVILVCVYGPIWLIHKNSGRLAGIKEKLAGYFFYNGLIRLIFETSFDMVLAATLNMYKVDWGTSFSAVRFSTALTLISLILAGILYPF